MGIVTLDDIAGALGISRAQACRALSGKGRVSPETRARAVKLASKMGYRPNHNARSLILGKTNLVGVIGGPVIISAFELVVDPIEQALGEAGYSMLFCRSTGEPDSEHIYIEQIIPLRVDGLIVHPGPYSMDCTPYEQAIANGIKLVIFGAYIKGLDVPQMAVDEYRPSKLATEHLLALGHRRIVYMALPETSPAGIDRMRGFRDAMSAAGVPLTESSAAETGFGSKAGAEMMTRLLKSKSRPTAVIARHDTVALGAMEAVLAAGLSVPKDISIVGHGDIIRTTALKAPLTSIRYPWTEMAEFAVNTLLDMFGDRPVDMGLKVWDCELIVRQSTAPPRPH
ncbi:MAG: LacI family DNA-binding transcriptional regulator [Armatimonadetes bacterium]|nr:LacI family DNA-binding transcriptional regulator [Armatimonadota bacterium]